MLQDAQCIVIYEGELLQSIRVEKSVMRTKHKVELMLSFIGSRVTVVTNQVGLNMRLSSEF